MRVKKCDACGSLEETGNPVTQQEKYITLKLSDEQTSPSASVTILIASRYSHKEVCLECRNTIIRSQYAAVASLMAPYAPRRVSGFVQGLEEAGAREELVARLGALLLPEKASG